jgi:hypothetical protein
MEQAKKEAEASSRAQEQQEEPTKEELFDIDQDAKEAQEAADKLLHKETAGQAQADKTRDSLTL